MLPLSRSAYITIPSARIQLCRYTVVEDDGSTHGVVFINSAAQEFETFPLPGLVYRTIGGLLDILVFMGPSPEQVLLHCAAR